MLSIKQYPSRRKRDGLFLVLLSVVVALVLAVTVLVCVRRTREKMNQYSFNELAALTQDVARKFYDATTTDRIILSAMAELLAEQPEDDLESAFSIMDSFDLKTSFVTYVELLLPDGRLYRQDGSFVDASGKLDFAAESQKGAYVSDRECDVRDSSIYVLRNAVPVVKDGRTVAMLYGVASLQELSDHYEVDVYDGNAFVLGVDGTSGDFLLDTWHHTLRNISDLNDRTFLMEFTYQEMVQNLKNGVSGNLSTVSQTVGKPVLMHYEPVGVNNWIVCVGVTQDIALAGTRSCVEGLYWMALIIGVTLLAYMGVVTRYLVDANRRVYQIGVTDQVTGLLNRSAYEDKLRRSRSRTQSFAACIYIDVNGLHEINNQQGHAAGDQMLQTVVDCLRQQFPDAEVYRIGGDEFVAFPPQAAPEQYEQNMQNMCRRLAKQGYSIAYGIVSAEQMHGLDALVQQADEKMLENKKRYYAGREQRTPR